MQGHAKQENKAVLSLDDWYDPARGICPLNKCDDNLLAAVLACCMCAVNTAEGAALYKLFHRWDSTHATCKHTSWQSCSLPLLKQETKPPDGTVLVVQPVMRRTL